MVAVLLLSVGTGVSTAAPPPTPVPGAHTVTLITGDRVKLDGTGVVPGPGREHVTFHRFHRDGRLHVIPQDAVRPLARDRLDPRLFDVTGLVAAGYTDAEHDTLPLIVTRTGGLPRAGVHVTGELPVVGAVAVETPKSDSAATYRALLDDPGVRKVWLDGVHRPTLDRATGQVGAPTAWQAGYTGKGVKVAVLDTGVEEDHPDLVGREVAERNFGNDPDAADLIGHGTPIASAIAGTGRYGGVAPDAQLIDAKVCSLETCRESWILDGMRWAVEQGADVVSVSVGAGDKPGGDLLGEAIDALSAQHGTLFVVAAGNGGPAAGTVTSPGGADAALTVGAVDRNDGLAPFSGRGPRNGDGGVKPDVTAPGVDIVAARSSTGRIGVPVDAHHMLVSGTSIATPLVAGAAALLAEQHPEWTGAQLKAALMASAEPNPDLTAFDQGTGRIDLAEAITTTVTADPPSLALGHHRWPHDDDTPVTKTLTYRNTGAGPVTLDLTVDATGPDGRPAPTGLFTVTPATVTVPAGGAAEVAVTADPGAAAVDGPHSGTVVASGGSTEVRVPVGVVREVESYDVTFNFVDAAGRPAADYFALAFSLDTGGLVIPLGEGGTATARLAKGSYFVTSQVLTGGTRRALLPRPDLTVTGDTRITFDARTAKPLDIAFPDPNAETTVAEVIYNRTHGGVVHNFGTSAWGGLGPDVSIAHVGPAVPDDALSVVLSAQAKGTPVGDVPVTYRFAWLERGKVPTGFVRAPARHELAEVRSQHGGPADRRHSLSAAPISPEGTPGGWRIWATDVTAPGAAIDRVTTGPLPWRWSYTQHLGGVVEAALTSPDRTYQPGRAYRQRFNAPVFGPTRPDATRVGDAIHVSVPLFGDGSGSTGTSATASARTALLRDEVRVGETAEPGRGSFTVPPGGAAFRLEAEATRAPGVSEFATRVSGAWTFRSDTAAGRAVLPLTVVRFTPDLDAHGAAPAGRVLRVPLVVERQGGAHVARLRVEVSFDDGGSWSAVPVVGRTALVRNPAAGGYASLRVKGSDGGGNTFTHTVVRAYKIS